jgi:hypothetical protein
LTGGATGIAFVDGDCWSRGSAGGSCAARGRREWCRDAGPVGGTSEVMYAEATRGTSGVVGATQGAMDVGEATDDEVTRGGRSDLLGWRSDSQPLFPGRYVCPATASSGNSRVTWGVGSGAGMGATLKTSSDRKMSKSLVRRAMQ